jgi:hypothetical protein
MHDILKDRILRRLDALPEERVYQVLDYIEFLESKYAKRQSVEPNVFQRFAEGVEDTLRAGNVSATAVSEAMGFMSKAMGVLNGVAAAGKSVANEIVGAPRPSKGNAANTAAAARPAAPSAPSTGKNSPPPTGEDPKK